MKTTGAQGGAQYTVLGPFFEVLTAEELAERWRTRRAGCESSAEVVVVTRFPTRDSGGMFGSVGGARS